MFSFYCNFNLIEDTNKTQRANMIFKGPIADEMLMEFYKFSNFSGSEKHALQPRLSSSFYIFWVEVILEEWSI